MFCIPTGKLYNIAMENWPFEDVFPSENGVVHCYVSLPEGIWWNGEVGSSKITPKVVDDMSFTSERMDTIIGTLFGLFPPNATLPWFRVANLMFVSGECLTTVHSMFQPTVISGELEGRDLELLGIPNQIAGRFLSVTTFDEEIHK